MGTPMRRTAISNLGMRRTNETMRLFVTTFVGIIFGFFLGVSFPTLTLTKVNLPSNIFPSIDLTYMEDRYSGLSTQALLNIWSSLKGWRGISHKFNNTKAFKHIHADKKPAGVLKTLIDVITQSKSTTSFSNSLQSYRVLWTGLGSQLARDVPFSAICWSTLEPARRALLGLVGDEANAASVLGANFSAGFVAGSLAAATTCPLDVAKTRRQIEKDPVRALKMTTRQTLLEVWRDGGIRGLFTGVGPRVGRAGPSVGIVISFYEVVKYMLHHQYAGA